MASRRRGRKVKHARLLTSLGPGLITGAADDDPGGVATYSQAGAQFGTNMLWTVAFTYPLLVAVQLVCARIGRATGQGLAANMIQVFPRWAAVALIALLFLANTINIGADIGAMGAAANLIVGGDPKIYTLAFALVTLGLQLFVPYHRYVTLLKWLTLALFAYVGVVFTVHINWLKVAVSAAFPHLDWRSGAAVTVVVAIFGTTISPYLFFWQSSEEVEEMEKDGQPDLKDESPAEAREELRRISFDTFVGMAVSHVIAFFIILTTAVTLNAAGKTDIQTSADAAMALRPIAGDFAFALFSLGIIGTGFLAVPVLAGSSAYAIADLRGWKTGLEYQPWEAPGFYGVIGASVLIALAVVFSPLDPIKALFWSAVLNGVISVPIMAALMIVASRRDRMGAYVATRGQTFFGWLATVAMGVAAIAMLINPAS
jgi:NRAMP (natural resistance-associated macrophage protein)-like metal ion transporter